MVATFRSTAGVILAAASVLVTIPADAGRSGFRTYSTEHGLAQSQVMSVVQDCNGFIWAGSSGAGLSRFDGNEFRIHTVQDGLAGNVVRALAEGRCGELWVGTDNGVSRFDGEQFETLPLPGGPTSVRALAYESGVLWIGTAAGAFRHDGRGAERVPMPGHGGVEAIYPERDGSIWFGTTIGLIHWQGGEFETYTTGNGLPHAGVVALGQDRRGVMWIGTPAGLASWDGVRIRAVDPTTTLGVAPISAIAATRDGELWVGTNDQGLCRLYDDDSQSCLGEPSGLPSPTVWALVEDTEGNLWIGTYRGGLARFSSQPFHEVLSGSTLARDTVRAVRESRDGAIWVGTFRNGVVRIADDDQVDREMREVLADPFVIDVLEDGTGAMWFGTRHGLSRLKDGQVRSWTRANGLPDDVIRYFLEDDRGRIWVATNVGGIVIFDGDRLTRVGVDEGLSNLNVMHLVQGSEGIWIATLDGVYFHDGQKVVDASERYGWVRRNVYSIAERPDGSVWVAAFGSGVFRCETGRDVSGPMPACSRLDRREGLPSDNVVSLLFDMDDYLWVGTEDGVARIDAAAWVAGRDPRIESFNAVDGLGVKECVHNAVLEDSHGRIWFGTVGGLFRHEPSSYRRNSVPPPVRITSVHPVGDDADGDPGNTRPGLDRPPPTVTLPHGRAGLDIGFAGISLSAPERVRYRHRLLGLDETWSNAAAETLVRYRSLSPGSYTFEVEAANVDGVWSAAPASYAFRVSAPFWRTPWFVATAIVVALGAMVSGFRLRGTYLVRRNRELEDRVARSTRRLALQAEHVERLNAELEHKVAMRTDELVQANEQLHSEIARREQLESGMLRASKLESLAVLAGGIAHDFNNLLTAILGNISLTRDDFERRGLRCDNLELAEQACMRSRELTTQLLTFSRGGAPVTRTLSLAPVVREGIGLALRGSNVKAVYEVDDDIANVRGDRGQLSQVLGNLALNAVQAMPAGGQLTVRCGNARLPPEAAAQVPLPAGDYVRLSLSDEGPGIDNTVLPRIFDPYFTTKEHGHGLGLATVHSIVLRHEGWIEVDSAPGSGTTFHVYLPASPETLSAVETTRRPYRNRQARVLLMDDEADVRSATNAMLQSVGCTVESAADGGEAIDRFRKAHENGEMFDLVILDLTVPGGLGGIETIGELLQIDSRTRAVVSSGYSHEGALAAYRRHGFCDALPKPFTMAELERAVDSALAAREGSVGAELDDG